MQPDIVRHRLMHRGWFGLCPIYISNAQHGRPMMVARRSWMRTLLHWQVVVATGLINRGLMDYYPVLLTGDIKGEAWVNVASPAGSGRAVRCTVVGRADP